jgi:hypothetical protein
MRSALFCSPTVWHAFDRADTFSIQRITDVTRVPRSDDRARHLSYADLAVAALEFAASA